ncbi:haloacid dehalogenase [Bacillus coahuilensis p1.1.43]|uniref:Haloacid dehalogenase n=1 Tax=Bacillus coahuilensis p1.1.43 TaxID=1150625 RepID=A0A147K5U3_9BACI|nr:haloacid dehalogenase type II [Bacillus coahuilensis]KUP05175.1 haloacid dehalogenase [Bacillus coahuilensis p1.1.43]
MVSNIKAIVFDVYGTLFDVHSIVKKCEEEFGDKGQEVSLIWRQKQVEYSFLRELMGRYQPFSKITFDALKYAVSSVGIQPKEEQLLQLMAEYQHLTPYKEVETVLSSLKGKQLAVFSNGSRDMLEPLLNNSGLQSYFSSILSVDDRKAFKPTPTSYTAVLEELQVERKEVLFLSSNGWDISGAKSFGFQTAWVNRKGSPREQLDLQPDIEIEDLSELVNLL